MNYLPRMITANFGLREKLSEINRELPTKDRADGWCLDYESGQGLVHNVKTGAVYGKYIQVINNKYKLVKEAK